MTNSATRSWSGKFMIGLLANLGSFPASHWLEEPEDALVAAIRARMGQRMRIVVGLARKFQLYSSRTKLSGALVTTDEVTEEPIVVP